MERYTSAAHNSVLVNVAMLMFCCRLMLMALYNVSISVKGLKYISESPGLLPLIWILLEGKEAIRNHTSLIYNNSAMVQTTNDIHETRI